MNYGLTRLAELPVSVRLIREIHERLLQGERGARLTPGELRRTQNWIGPGGCTLSEASFIPPPSHEVPEVLGALETFLHADSEIPALIQNGLAHAQFETIHPFLDGNGRVGRLLISLLLCQREILLKPVLYLSHFFKRHRAEPKEVAFNPSITLVARSVYSAARLELTLAPTAVRGHLAAVLGVACLAALASYSKSSNN